MLCIKKLLTITLTATFLLVSGMAVAATPVPDTGQTKCYNDSAEIPCPIDGEDFYGQDANYNINPISFTTIDGIMVKDNVTGLIWELKNSKDGTKDYSNPHDADNTINQNRKINENNL